MILARAAFCPSSICTSTSSKRLPRLTYYTIFIHNIIISYDNIYIHMYIYIYIWLIIIIIVIMIINNICYYKCMCICICICICMPRGAAGSRTENPQTSWGRPKGVLISLRWSWSSISNVQTYAFLFGTVVCFPLSTDLWQLIGT